jgi:hypothetical protein
MAGYVPAIHAFAMKKDVDARHKARHDVAASVLHVQRRENETLLSSVFTSCLPFADRI